MVKADHVYQAIRKINPDQVEATMHECLRMMQLLCQMALANNSNGMREIDKHKKNTEQSLALLYEKATTVLHKIKLHHVALAASYPEVLVMPKQEIVRGGFLWETRMVDEQRRLSDFTLVQTIVRNRVLVMSDREKRKWVIKRLMGQRQFHREAETMARVGHPLVMPIACVFFGGPEEGDNMNGCCYIQMPFCNAGTLRNWVLRIETRSGECCQKGL